MSQYCVVVTNNYEGFEDESKVIRFSADSQEDVASVMECIASHYSGDPLECRINGEVAVLEGDWGLLRADQ